MPGQPVPNDREIAPAALAARGERSSVMMYATVRHAHGGTTRQRMRDVSRGGIRIDQALDLRPGERVAVSVGALSGIAADVRWTREGCAGLAFTAPIDPADARRKAGAASAAPIPTIGAREPATVPAAGWIGDLRDAYKTPTRSMTPA